MNELNKLADAAQNAIRQLARQIPKPEYLEKAESRREQARKNLAESRDTSKNLFRDLETLRLREPKGWRKLVAWFIGSLPTYWKERRQLEKAWIRQKEEEETRVFQERFAQDGYVTKQNKAIEEANIERARRAVLATDAENVVKRAKLAVSLLANSPDLAQTPLDELLNLAASAAHSSSKRAERIREPEIGRHRAPRPRMR